MELNERIKDLRAQIAAQEKYNDFFCSKVSDYNTLQSNLSVLQQPTITAIKKLAGTGTTNLESRDLTKFFSVDTRIPFIPTIPIDKVNANGDLPQTLIPKFTTLNVTALGKIKSFMEITLKGNKIYLYEEKGATLDSAQDIVQSQKFFLFKSEAITYSDGLFRIILGIPQEIEPLNDVDTYLSKLIYPFQSNSKYVNDLKNRLDPQRGRKESDPQKVRKELDILMKTDGISPLNIPIRDDLTLLTTPVIDNMIYKKKIYDNKIS